jgi:hypothetical protein
MTAAISIIHGLDVDGGHAISNNDHDGRALQTCMMARIS